MTVPLEQMICTQAHKCEHPTCLRRVAHDLNSHDSNRGDDTPCAKSFCYSVLNYIQCIPWEQKKAMLKAEKKGRHAKEV